MGSINITCGLRLSVFCFSASVGWLCYALTDLGTHLKLHFKIVLLLILYIKKENILVYFKRKLVLIKKGAGRRFLKVEESKISV